MTSMSLHDDFDYYDTERRFVMYMIQKMGTIACAENQYIFNYILGN